MRTAPTLLVYDGEIPDDADAPLCNARLLAEMPLELNRTAKAIHGYGVDDASNANGVARFARVVSRNGTVLQVLGHEIELFAESGERTAIVFTGMRLEARLEITMTPSAMLPYLMQAMCA